MRGIELRCVRSVWAFRTLNVRIFYASSRVRNADHSLQRGDPVPSSTFPLPKTPSNLNRMLCISRAGSAEGLVQPDKRVSPVCGPDDLALSILDAAASGADLVGKAGFEEDIPHPKVDTNA